MPRLSAEQRALRLSGIGASEASAIVGLNPYKGPLDIWLRKPVGGRPPLVDEAAEAEHPQAQVGHILEPALRELFTARTGVKLVGASATLRHADLDSVLASPDDLAVAANDGGLEIKVVGSHLAHHWAEDSVPDYVTCQVAQCMSVTDRDRWHVLALVGSVPKLYVIDRDLELEEQLLTEVVSFWEVNVRGDVPPEPVTWEERKRYLRERYPGSAKSACRPEPDLDGEIGELLGRRGAAAELKANAEAAYEELTAQLCEHVGDAYGIEGPFGKFLWYGVQGRVDWQAVAEELAGGSIPLAVIEKHRGEGHRVARHYPPKKSSSRRSRT